MSTLILLWLMLHHGTCKPPHMHSQSLLFHGPGVAEADVVVLLVDGRVGLQPGDRDVLSWLRAQQPAKEVLLAVNKCDNPGSADLAASEFWELGLEPHPVSAINGSGTGDMLDALVKVGLAEGWART
jgi:predicted GTPase